METRKPYVKPVVTKHQVKSKRILCHAGILILTFALGCNKNQAQVIILNNTGSNDSLYNKVCTYVCRKLDIRKVQIIISPIAFDQEIYWTEGGLASVHRFAPDYYGINILQSRNMKKLTLLLIHEIYHIRQILDKRLWISDKANWFEGKLYTDNNSDYYERPYEIEADKFTREFYKENKKEIRLIIKSN